MIVGFILATIVAAVLLYPYITIPPKELKEKYATVYHVIIVILCIYGAIAIITILCVFKCLCCQDKNSQVAISSRNNDQVCPIFFFLLLYIIT
jgi:hypothetical protein